MSSAPAIIPPPATSERPRRIRAGEALATTHPRLARLADYYELTKPRMNLLVLLTTAVGYYMAPPASTGASRTALLLCTTLLGTAMTAASAAVLNQWIERRHDARMPRTRFRPVAAQRVTPIEALVLGVVLAIAGLAVLFTAVNPLTAALGLATWASYLFVYTPLKRVTAWNTVVGAVPGALPPLMGWTAVANAASPGGWALFAILFVWQLPHFFAIATMYRDDYSAGGFRMLPCDDPGLRRTSLSTLLGCMVLIPVSLLPTALGIAGIFYALAAVLLGAGFMAAGMGLVVSRSRPDARRLFFTSIIYLPLLLGVMVLDRR